MASWISSIITRVVIKTIVDFTLIIHFRHPCDIGGMYWSMNVVLNQALCFLSVYLYEKFATEKNSNIAEHLFYLVFGLFLISVLNFLMFLSLINKKYLGTFFNTQTGKQFLCETWQIAGADKERFYIFSKHKSYYKSINKELKEWLSENWEKWEEEKEDWFTAKMIGRIPSELLPEKALEKYRGEGEIERKESIAAAMIKAEEKEEVVEKARKASAAQLVPSG